MRGLAQDCQSCRLVFPEFTRFMLAWSRMPKLDFVCEHCGSPFQKYPAFVRDAEKRGSRIKFCSRKCTDAARKAGTLAGRVKTGKMVNCVTCGAGIYRNPKFLRRSKVFACSEACRIAAISQSRIDRKLGPKPQLKRGETTSCRICGKEQYRKQSIIDRRAAMTCGSRDCKSAYGRQLWGLNPYTPEQRRIRKGPQRRTTNFTAAQRAQWLDTKCRWCWSTENLCLDHIRAVAAGGLSVRSNAQTLCQPCNNWKMKYFDRPLALAYKQTKLGG